MAPDTHRFVTLDRVEEGAYVARNARGGALRIGGDGDEFTSVELLLAAIAACSAVDVDLVTGRRASPEVFTARVDAHKVREDGGNMLRDIVLTFDVTFPEGPAGDGLGQHSPARLPRRTTGPAR